MSVRCSLARANKTIPEKGKNDIVKFQTHIA